MRCDKCNGNVIFERYYCDKGTCSYLRCIQCGSLLFEPTKDMIEEDEGEVQYKKVNLRRSFADIGKELGITKQAAWRLYQRGARRLIRGSVKTLVSPSVPESTG